MIPAPLYATVPKGKTLPPDLILLAQDMRNRYHTSLKQKVRSLYYLKSENGV